MIQSHIIPVFKSTDHFLDEDNLIRDRLVPLNLQQHVMVILKGSKVNSQWMPAKLGFFLCE